MQKKPYATETPFDYSVIAKITAAGVCGMVIATLLVKIGIELDRIHPNHQYHMNEFVGVPVILGAMALATFSLKEHFRPE